MGTLHNDIGAYGGHGKYEPILSTDDPPHSQSMNINNYPNPFNTSTTISFYRTPNIHKEAQIEIYNLKGQKVIELLIVSQSQSPQVSVTWDGKDNRGKKVGPGIYFIYMKTGKNVNVKKIVKLGL